MKEKMYSLLFTFLLVFILTLLVILNIFVFVSGPARKAESDDEKLFRSVVSAYQFDNALLVNRHVHHRITFVATIGVNNEKMIFYDEAGWVFLLIDTPSHPQTLSELISSGSISEADVSYGFFNTPVFVIENDNRLQYIDLNGESVFYLKKGD